MINRILYFIILLGLFATTSLNAQNELSKKLSNVNIKGTNFITYPAYSGSPYFNQQFLIGELDFIDGTKIESIGLRYSSYRDEIIYYNTDLSTQIVIDKISLKGFSFTEANGVKRVFRLQNYTGVLNGERFFEVLSDGEIALLAYRKVDLGTCDPAYSKLGLAYQKSYSYYIYSDFKGYSPIALNRNSLLSKFTKPNQKLAKKILRKNRVVFSDEASFVFAWNLLKENGIPINF